MRQQRRVNGRGPAVIRGIAAGFVLLACDIAALFAGGERTGARLRIGSSIPDQPSAERIGQAVAVGARLVVLGCATWLLIAVAEQTISAWRGRPPTQPRRGRFSAIAAAIVLTGAGPAPESSGTTQDAQTAATDPETVTLTPVDVPGSVTQTATTATSSSASGDETASTTGAAEPQAVAACGPAIAVTARTDIRSEALDYLAGALGREPTDAEADEYWNRCVLANQASLPDPAEPEVVAPGSVLVLPEPTEMPRTL